MPTATDIIRRPMLTEPGEPLAVLRSPLDGAFRYSSFSESSNLPPDRIIVSNLLCVPAPIAVPADHPRDRWPGLNPAMLWHPLFWLPERITGRYMVTDPDTDEDTLETEETWAVRVGIELTTSGAYSVEQGDWLDVLHYAAGLNVSEAEDLQRVVAWFTGGADPDLDAVQAKIDGLYEQPEDPEWAIQYALDMTPAFGMMSWAFQSEALLEICNDVLSVADGIALEVPGEQPSLEQAQYMGSQLAMLGRKAFNELDDSELAWWDEIQDVVIATQDDLQALVDGPVRAMADRVESIRDMYWPVVEAMAGGDDSEPGPSTVNSPPEDSSAPQAQEDSPGLRGGWG